jgi:hypothetical protein
MGSLDQQIATAFQASSLVLVFVTVLFGLRYDQIQKDVRKEIPARDPELKCYKCDLLIESLILKCGLLVLVNGATVYLFLPLAVRIMCQSRFDPWNFDFARTSFLLIAALVFAYFIWSCCLACQVLRRIMERPPGAPPQGAGAGESNSSGLARDTDPGRSSGAYDSVMRLGGRPQLTITSRRSRRGAGRTSRRRGGHRLGARARSPSPDGGPHRRGASAPSARAVLRTHTRSRPVGGVQRLVPVREDVARCWARY